MFELTAKEFKNLRTQIATSSWGGSRYPPFAFNEYGVAMLSSVLNSPKAIQTNIAIIKAFISLRRHALTYVDLNQKMAELEDKFNKEFADVNEVLKWLGEENQARHNEVKTLKQSESDKNPESWAARGLDIKKHELVRGFGNIVIFLKNSY